MMMGTLDSGTHDDLEYLTLAVPSNGLMDHISPPPPRTTVPQSHTHSHTPENPVLNTQAWGFPEQDEVSECN